MKKKKMYEIKYKVIGEKRIDFICFYAKSVLDAIKMFTEFEFEFGDTGRKFHYSEYAIVSVN